MASPFTPILQTLGRQRGVTAALIVSEQDGIIIDSHTHIGLAGERVAALAASLYRKARLSSLAAGLGRVSFMQLEAPQGRVCAVGAGEMVVVIVAATAINVGMARVAMLRAAEALRGIQGVA
jgi:predicted regulator of Ras-like GTPase activity (Roadblock/LC7/MglB family)